MGVRGMMIESSRSALRAQIFLDGADEIDKIDDPNCRTIVMGRIGVCVDALLKKIGRSGKDLARNDIKEIELLTTVAQEALGVRIRNQTHLFEVLNVAMKPLGRDAGKAKKTDRQNGARIFRAISKELLNGHGDCDI